MLKWNGGGEVAKDLSGLYTSEGEARAAIAAWSNKQPPSRKKNIEVVLDGKTKD
jgi:hypothetical protein